MMISSSLPSSNAAPASEGRITQAKDVQGFSQRNASGHTPLNQSATLSKLAVPSFRLAAQTFSSEERKEATTATTEENADINDPIVKISSGNVPEGSRRFIATVLGAYVVFGYAMYNILQEFEWFYHAQCV